MMEKLSTFVKLQRRYTRSVNLERDLQITDSVLGYIPTSRAIDTLGRILSAMNTPGSVRAWTLTGVYGTGKSAFAHFVASICSSDGNPMRQYSHQIAEKSFVDSQGVSVLLKNVPSQGLLRAAVTCQREPVGNAVIRALHRGASLFWDGFEQKPELLKDMHMLIEQIDNGYKIQNHEVLSTINQVTKMAGTGVLLLLDELGKALECAAQQQKAEDLYLLQQIAEMPAGKHDPVVLIVGLLHQSFADYANGLTTAHRNEWGKIQGRFEDIPFAESPEQVMRLIGHAIQLNGSSDINHRIKEWSTAWYDFCVQREGLKGVSLENIRSVYPLHPITTLIVPTLCSRYAQNDRSLFTFLTSEEPHSFTNFIRETTFDDRHLPTLKPHQLYDYFVENAGMSLSSRTYFQRWAEIQGRITEARQLEPDLQSALKTIGVLNLITSTGPLKAARELVVLCLCDNPEDHLQFQYWDQVIERLLEKGQIVWRKSLNELRIWEGSDFDVELESRKVIESLKTPLADLLTKYFPLRPLVAQRHSYMTGTLRYFERIYLDDPKKLVILNGKIKDSDGVICYWLGDESYIGSAPPTTVDGKPVVIVSASDLPFLIEASNQFVALQTLENTASPLQTDGVARREVRQRLIQATNLLETTLQRVFDVTITGVTCLVQQKHASFKHRSSFNAMLSDLCDEVYDNGLRLWNEHINRRVLTSNGAKARRELLEALLEKSDEERLGMTGYGPERSMYESLLAETGIHSFDGQKWLISSPSDDSGVSNIWNGIEQFCLSAIESPSKISDLYEKLSRPPYGVKDEVIPILLATVLLYHMDDVCMYQDGTFIAKLGTEHFELLVKQPKRFSVKYISLHGVRAEVFRELESVLRKSTTIGDDIRNKTLLSLVNPLVQTIRKLPGYTLKTKRLTEEAIQVRNTLLGATEPDYLLFEALPRACGLTPFSSESDYQLGVLSGEYKRKLVNSINELQTAYDVLLSRCQQLLCNAFGIGSEEQSLRYTLTIRAVLLVDKCVERRLRSFIHTITNDVADDKTWIESIVMIIADKPPQSWLDYDVDEFEINLANMARRFMNFEALQHDAASSQVKQFHSRGLKAKRITVTDSTGEEQHQLVWIEEQTVSDSKSLADQILDNLVKSGKGHLAEAVLVNLMEKVLLSSTDKQ